MATTTFDASKYLTDLNGRDYVEVKWRLLWLRTEHPEAVIETELVRHGAGLALFRARVAIPGAGVATGWGSETHDDFEDYIEKAETKALGRALAALGYGTQFCEDFDFSAEREGGRRSRRSPEGKPEARSGQRRHQPRVVDAPVARPKRAESEPASGGPVLKIVRERAGEAATSSQINAIYAIARDQQAASGPVDERCRAAFGCLPAQLTKRQASEFIEQLRRPAPAVSVQG